jgi:hypothetical protein
MAKAALNNGEQVKQEQKLENLYIRGWTLFYERPTCRISKEIRNNFKIGIESLFQ